MGIPYPPGDPLACRQIRELDVLAIEHVGIPGIVLMENAGRGTAEFIFDRLVNPRASRVVILCGPGNNGGDGFVVARHLINARVPVNVVLAVPPERSSGDAGTNLRVLERMNVALIQAHTPEGQEQARQAMQSADIIVDALLGTGSRGAPREAAAKLVEWANTAPCARRIAIDIPSGLNADTGAVHEPCFRAVATVTMVAPKEGFMRGGGPGVVGRVVTVDIGIPRALIPGREHVDR